MPVILASKPVLIGLHLVFAILGIDAFLWLMGEVLGNFGSVKRRVVVAVVGFIGYFAAWLVGGYYYVKYYGSLVKPVIIKGSAPWAHNISMEAKEHIFLFLVPLAITILFLSRLDTFELKSTGLKTGFLWLLGITAGLGLSIGLMGYIISAAARWAV